MVAQGSGHVFNHEYTVELEYTLVRDDARPVLLYGRIEDIENGSDGYALYIPAYFTLLELPLPENREQILTRLAKDDMIFARQDGLWDVLNLGPAKSRLQVCLCIIMSCCSK